MTDFITLLENSIKKNPDQIALTEYPGDEITYGQLGQNIARLQTEWSTLGLQKGDHIAICAENSIHWVEVFLAAVMGGYVAVLLQANSVNEENINEYLEHSDTRLLYTRGDLLKSVDYSKVRTLQGVFDVASLTAVSQRDETVSGKLDTVLDLEEIGLGTLSEICIILYTSGTTGKPKGVAESIETVSLFNMTNIRAVPFEISGNHVTMLPFSHIFGLMTGIISPISLSLRLVLLLCPLTPFNVCSALQTYNPSVFHTVPFIVESIVSFLLGKLGLKDLLLQSDIDNTVTPNVISDLFAFLLSSFGNIKQLVVGGSQSNYRVECFLVNFLNFPYVSGYGISESYPVSLGITHSYKVGSCGVVLHPESVRIMTSNDSNSGELQIKKKYVFSGYYKDPKNTNDSFTDDGWFKTRDLGRLEDDNTLYVFGRIDNAIVLPNGENIFPEAIEKEINKSQFVSESLVFLKEDKLSAILVVNQDIVCKMQMNERDLKSELENHMIAVNKILPGYLAISNYIVSTQPLKRTIKGEIVRDLSANNNNIDYGTGL